MAIRVNGLMKNGVPLAGEFEVLFLEKIRERLFGFFDHPTTSFVLPHHLFFTIAKQSVRFANKISGGAEGFATGEVVHLKDGKRGGGVIPPNYQ